MNLFPWVVTVKNGDGQTLRTLRYLKELTAHHIAETINKSLWWDQCNKEKAEVKYEGRWTS